MDRLPNKLTQFFRGKIAIQEFNYVGDTINVKYTQPGACGMYYVFNLICQEFIV